jgi:hypothetical protein
VHEKRVDRACRPKENAFVRREVSPAEQSTHARQRRVGHEAALAYDATVGTPQRPFTPRGSTRLASLVRERCRPWLERISHNELHEPNGLPLTSLA